MAGAQILSTNLESEASSTPPLASLLAPYERRHAPGVGLEHATKQRAGSLRGRALTRPRGGHEDNGRGGQKADCGEERPLPGG